MRNICIAAAALALGACATTSPTSGIRSLGPNQFTVSEMSGFTSVAERAAAFCGSFGQRMQIEGSTTQKGLYSGSDYAVLVFSCQDVPR